MKSWLTLLTRISLHQDFRQRVEAQLLRNIQLVSEAHQGQRTRSAGQFAGICMGRKCSCLQSTRLADAIAVPLESSPYVQRDRSSISWNACVEVQRVEEVIKGVLVLPLCQALKLWLPVVVQRRTKHCGFGAQQSLRQSSSRTRSYRTCKYQQIPGPPTSRLQNRSCER